MPLLDAVGPHDVEDAHADIVSVAAASGQASQRQAGKQATQWVVGGAGLLAGRATRGRRAGVNCVVAMRGAEMSG